MLPIPQAGIGGIQFPSLPPTPSGPNPTGPNNFSRMYDNMLTNEVSAPRGLPTSMEVPPLIAPASSISEPFKASIEFPGAVDPDGLLQPGARQMPRQDAAGEYVGLLSPFQNGLNEVNRLQAHSKSMAEEAAMGGDVDLHDVMIAGEKASVAMQLTMQVRNKLVEAYQEVMRMQV